MRGHAFEYLSRREKRVEDDDCGVAGDDVRFKFWEVFQHCVYQVRACTVYVRAGAEELAGGGSRLELLPMPRRY